MFKLEGEEEKAAAKVSNSSDPSRLSMGAPAAALPGRQSAPQPASEHSSGALARLRARWRPWLILSRFGLFLGLALIVSGGRYKGKLPDPGEVVDGVRAAPSQTASSREPFTFSYRGSSYTVTPKAEYVLNGVVVTHNNISGIGDAYHTSDSVDMKDVCVVWGNNLSSKNYQRITYTSEPWTCVINSKDESVWERFFLDELSNNHLLAGDEAVQRRIRSVRIGDQITLTGVLVDYCPLGYPDYLRKTSLVRTDTGNGACEVVFVESFSILKRSTPEWYLAYRIGWWMLGFAIALRLFIFVRAPLGAER
jgi:hypothetical protein